MFLSFIHRNMFHQKNKLALSVAGIASSIALILLLMGFRAGLYSTMTAFVENIGADLIIAQSGVQGIFSSNSALPLNIHEPAVEFSGATNAGHILMADIIFSREGTKTPVLLVGYEPETTFGSPWKLDSGRNIQADNEISIDSWLAQRAGITIGEGVNVLGREFTVVGLTDETSSWMSPYIFVTLNASEQVLGLSGIVSYHLLRLPDDVDPGTMAKDLEIAIPGIRALTPGKIAEADRRVLANIMDSPINVMLVIGVSIGVVVMGLTAYTAVADRMQEYGVLKALGASNRLLIWLVSLETLYRSALGYILGIGLANLSAEGIMAYWPQFNVVMETSTVLQAGALAIGMSLLSTLFPIRRLNQIDPALVFKS